MRALPDTQAVPLLQRNGSLFDLILLSIWGLTGISSRHAQAAVVNGGTKNQPCDSSSLTERLLRGLGLGLIYQLYMDRTVAVAPERKKIPIRKGLGNAIRAGLIHLLPMVATITLIVLNCRGYYIGSELSGISNQDDEKFLGLQFAAKLHELVLNASLTAVVFSYIRHEMAVADGIPFGAIFAGFQFRELSFLWSSEFWGAARANFSKSRRKCAFFLLILTCIILGVSVGPSSATLMRPRLDYWPAGGTDFWIGIPQDELTSRNVTASQVPTSCSVDTGDPSCPYADWQTVAQNYLAFWPSPRVAGYLPNGFYIPSAKSTRFANTATRSPYWQYSKDWTVATISSSSIADGLSESARLWVLAATKDLTKGAWGKTRFWSRIDALFHLEAKQPVVQARCLQSNASTHWQQSDAQGSNASLSFYDLSLDLYNGIDFPKIFPTFPNNASIVSLLAMANSSSMPQLLWTNIVQKDAGSSLAALLSVPAKLQNDSSGTQLYACTLDARLAPALMEASANGPLYVSGFLRGTYETAVGDYKYGGVEKFETGSLETYAFGDSWPRISIDRGWAEYLNPTNGSGNSTVIGSMLQMTGLWNATKYVNPNDSRYAVEAVLANMVANGLARRDYGSGFAGHLFGHEDQLLTEGSHVQDSGDFTSMCGDWCQRMLPATWRGMGYGSSAFNISLSNRHNSTKFTMRTSANGYAYSSKGAGQIIAIVVLCLYLAIVLIHWIYIVWLGESSSSWGSIAELVALASSSAPSKVFKNTGAGIDTLQIFKNRTQVIDHEGRLMLAFETPPGIYKKIKINEPYA